MKEFISRRVVTRQVRHHGSLSLTYLSNPKAGSSNIKAAMWAQIDRNTGRQTLPATAVPHRLNKTPFVQSLFDRDSYDFDRLEQSAFFTVVRNPFTRILSAYLNKIGARSDPHVWGAFCRRYGVDREHTKQTYPFKAFLHTIAGDEVEQLDPHFRPQYINVLYPFVPFSFIGKLERMTEAHDFMASCGIETGSTSRNRQRASEKIESSYDSKCEAIVQELYRSDFVAFGYSSALQDVEIVNPVPERGPMPNRLLEFIKEQEVDAKREARLDDIRARLAELRREREALAAEKDRLRWEVGLASA